MLSLGFSVVGLLNSVIIELALTHLQECLLKTHFMIMLRRPFKMRDGLLRMIRTLDD